MTKSAESLPHIVPTEGCFDMDGWSRGLDDLFVPLGEFIEGWDAESTMEARSCLRIDGPELCREIGTPPRDTVLQVVVIAETGTTGSRWSRVLFQQSVRGGEQCDLPIALPELSGRSLTSTLTLTTHVVLESAGGISRPASPTRRGCRLWQSSSTVDLDGDRRGFPVHPVDFERDFPEMKGAPWCVEMVSADPDSPLMSSVVVYLNTARSTVFESLETGKGELVGLLRADVIRTIIASVLSSTAVDTATLEGAEDGTLGAEVRTWLESLDPDLERVVGTARETPQRFAGLVASAWSQTDG